MWYTLQPNPSKVNVIKMMVKFWIYQRDKVPKGSITMGGYVTVLALRMRLPRLAKTICTGFHLYDALRYKNAQFIQIHTEWDGTERYLWLREGATDFYLPYPHRIDVSNPRTWLIPKDYAHPVAGPSTSRAAPSTSKAAPMETDAAPQVPQQEYDFSQASSWALGLRDMMGNLTTLTLETRDEVHQQGIHLSYLSHEVQQFGRRLDRVADVAYDNNFYLRNGYWPGQEDDPNLDSPAHSYHSHASGMGSHLPSHQSPIAPPYSPMPYEPQPPYEQLPHPSPPHPADSAPPYFYHHGAQHDGSDGPSGIFPPSSF